MAAERGGPKSVVQSVERACSLLLALGHTRQGASLSALSAAAGLHKSTARRLLVTLSGMGFVRQMPPDDLYTLGPRMPVLGEAAQTHLLLGPATHAILVELMNQTTETAHLATPDKFELVYLEKVESHWSVQASSRIGARAALYCTALGKSYLAFQPREVWAEYLEVAVLRPHTPNSLTSASSVINELVKIHKQGYALDNEENELGVRCVAAPILNELGISIAAISVMAPTGRLPMNRVPEMGELVSRAAVKLAHSAAGYGSSS